MSSVRVAYGTVAFSGRVSRSSHPGTFVVPTSSTESGESESPAGLRRCDCSRHGQGTRRPVWKCRRTGAGGQSGTARRRAYLICPAGFRTDPIRVTAPVRVPAAFDAITGFRSASIPAERAAAGDFWATLPKWFPTLAGADGYRGLRGAGPRSNRGRHRSFGKAEFHTGPNRRAGDANDIPVVHRPKPIGAGPVGVDSAADHRHTAAVGDGPGSK